MSDKTYTAVDVQAALKERLVKFEEQLKDLHARELRKDQHMEPGVHEAGQPGAEQHIEPGGHENSEMPMPQSPPEQPVGSSSGIPQGQLQDLCPMCGQPDMPGQCTCLNGGGNEGLDPAASGHPPVIDPNPTQPGNGVAPLALKEWEKPWEKKGCEHGDTCKSCGDMNKGYDFIDVRGKIGSKGNHPDAVLPDDKDSKKVKGPDDAKIKANGKGLAKVAVPMAKPPGGGTGLAPKPPAMAKPAAPKVGAPGQAPKPMGKGAQPMSPQDKKMMASHAAADSHKAAQKGPAAAAPKMIPKPPSHYDPKEYQKGEEPASREKVWGDKDKADKAKASEAKTWSDHSKEATAVRNGSSGKPWLKSELSKSMGVCLFCGNGEHAGMCGLAKNIQTSLAKVASPLFTAQPKLKPGAKGLGHVASSPELGNDTKGATSVGPAQSGHTVAGTPDRKKKKVKVLAFDANKHPAAKPLPPTGVPAIKGEK